MTYDEYTEKLNSSAVSAQRAVFDEYYPYVYTIVRSRLICCAKREDVEECVSDVFADIYIYLDNSTDYSGELTGVISVIAKRKSIDYYYRLSGKRIETEDLLERDITAEDDPEKDYEKKEQRKRLMQMIEELGEPDSTIVIQKYFFGYKSGEIARSVGLNSAAVRMRCSRALKKLKKKLLGSEKGGNAYEKEYI